MTETELDAAYEDCLSLARSHYENFPVASVLVTKELRRPIAAIYTFARRADDIADESDRSPNQKIAELIGMEIELKAVLEGDTPKHPLYLALHDSITRHQLEPQYFFDLIDAFKQDVSKTRYKNFKEVLDYCRRSANPVGRLLLQLNAEASDENCRDSDLICSALQLINFMQDIQQDISENDRVYFPQDEMRAAGVTDTDFKAGNTEPHVVKFVRFQTKRARKMLLQGAGLGKRLPGRFGLEIRTIIQGGLHISDALLNQGLDIYSRPRLTLMNKISMLSKALLKL